MIRTKDLTFTYPGGKPITFPDMHCEARDVLLLLGHSGVGKTTLLHLMGGLMSPQSGHIRIDEQDIAELKSEQLDRYRGKHIGIIFQNYHFVASLSVLENLLIAQYLGTGKQDKAYCLELLDRLNIKEKADRSINALSQGEKQRVAIARALANRPSVILADEPTSALDDENCVEVLNLLKDQTLQSNAALVIVTHDTRLKSEIANQITLTS